MWKFNNCWRTSNLLICNIRKPFKKVNLFVSLFVWLVISSFVTFYIASVSAGSQCPEWHFNSLHALNWVGNPSSQINMCSNILCLVFFFLFSPAKKCMIKTGRGHNWITTSVLPSEVAPSSDALIINCILIGHLGRCVSNGNTNTNVNTNTN